MATTQQIICPFSKPIVSRWCQCPYATQMERCSGKMVCSQSSRYYPQCTKLVAILQDHSSFILGIKKHDQDLTHAHAMKIRCGGLIGMHRVMFSNINTAPIIPDVIDTANNQFGDTSDFPYNQIINDIKDFSHRKKVAKNKQ